MNALSMNASIAQPVGTTIVKLGWEGNGYLSGAGRRQYAATIASYLTSVDQQGLLIRILEQSDRLVIAADLAVTGSFYDLLEGSTRSEKTATLVRGLLRCIAARYSPTEESYQTDVIMDQVPRMAMADPEPTFGISSRALNLIWRVVEGIGPITQYAPQAFELIKAKITADAGKSVIISFKSVVVVGNGASATAEVTVTGLNQDQVNEAFSKVQQIVSEEGQRTKPLIPNPYNAPTPDPVVGSIGNVTQTYEHDSSAPYQLDFDQ